MSVHVRLKNIESSPFCTRNGIEERILSILAQLYPLQTNFEFDIAEQISDSSRFGSKGQKIEDARISLEFISVLEFTAAIRKRGDDKSWRINFQFVVINTV